MSYQVIKGPALLRGHALNDAVIRTKGDIVINKRIPTFQVDTDDAANISRRVEDVIHEISFEPSGQFTEVSLIASLLLTPQRGKKVLRNLSRSVSGIASASGGTKITVTVTSAVTVYKGQYVTLTGMSVAGYNGTHLVDADSTGTTLTLVVAYTSTATGALKVPPCLVIHPIEQWADSEFITIYQNAGITSPPQITLAGNATMLGSMTISAVYHPFLSAADADAILRQATWAAPVSTVLDDLDPSQILTVPPRMRFGAYSADAFTGSDPVAAPWKDFATLAGARIALSRSLDPDKTDMRGTVNWTILEDAAVITAVPVPSVGTDEITDETVQKLLRQQDHGSDGVPRGGSLSPATPNELRLRLATTAFSGTYVDFIFHDTAITGAAAAFGTKASRSGEVTWTAVRPVASGSPGNLFTIEQD